MDNYFEKAKRGFEKKIPEYDSDAFQKMSDKIRKQLQKREAEHLLLLRSFKTLILGDWYTNEKRQILEAIKNKLLERGFYAQTIDAYYDVDEGSGLSPLQILETCCITHQLIVFIDGEGKGTITEQNYLCANYPFHGKTLFFIEESKFNQLAEKPNEYIKSFPAIVTYKKEELVEKVLKYSMLRAYRLADIIELQVKKGRGLKGSNYVPWKKRLYK